ncbi:MAG: RING finger protein 166-like protein [Terrestrivirus sp.]|uniref:RING finger protein 166-like protein n=1 Tax=Terrestrivirus sp. TaxID=2487775 RepID=A0A3G4ZS49_9VIRU|nr:MAG: RING finger protein 166-like protein [Terrestrivirus sp.]
MNQNNNSIALPYTVRAHMNSTDSKTDSEIDSIDTQTDIESNITRSYKRIKQLTDTLKKLKKIDTATDYIEKDLNTRRGAVDLIEDYTNIRERVIRNAQSNNPNNIINDIDDIDDSSRYKKPLLSLRNVVRNISEKNPSQISTQLDELRTKHDWSGFYAYLKLDELKKSSQPVEVNILNEIDDDPYLVSPEIPKALGESFETITSASNKKALELIEEAGYMSEETILTLEPYEKTFNPFIKIPPYMSRPPAPFQPNKEINLENVNRPPNRMTIGQLYETLYANNNIKNNNIKKNDRKIPTKEELLEDQKRIREHFQRYNEEKYYKSEEDRQKELKIDASEIGYGASIRPLPLTIDEFRKNGGGNNKTNGDIAEYLIEQLQYKPAPEHFNNTDRKVNFNSLKNKYNGIVPDYASLYPSLSEWGELKKKLIFESDNGRFDIDKINRLYEKIYVRTYIDVDECENLDILNKEYEYTCSICTCIFNKPQYLQCRHTFCMDCIKSIHNSKCPLCVSPFTSQHIIPNKELEEMISVLRYKCGMCNKTHCMNDCPTYRTKCKQCKKEMSVDQFLVHVTKKSPNNNCSIATSCIHCNVMYYDLMINDHQKVCDKQYYKCNKCKKLIEKKNKQDHTSSCVSKCAHCKGIFGKDEVHFHELKCKAKLNKKYHRIGNWHKQK